jgi:hypothetical protein
LRDDFTAFIDERTKGTWSVVDNEPYVVIPGYQISSLKRRGEVLTGVTTRDDGLRFGFEMMKISNE